MSCEHAHLDGAYVLGALSPAERREFERHLAGCEECSRSVRELAGLPGLLAHVTADDLEPADVPPLPATLLPPLVRRVRSTQRRRTAVVAATAAAVAALAVGGLAWGSNRDDGGRTAGGTPTASAAPSATPSALPMLAVGESPVSADVLLASVPWGTRLDLTCAYEEDEEDYEARPDATYALVVTTTDGRTEQVATWHGLPGKTMHLSAATATRRDHIATVEMQTADGLTVLRLPD